MKKFFVAVALTVLITPVWATSKTITLSVPSMDCQVCTITVKKALSKVLGVSQSNVNFDERQAMVTFDDSKTSVDLLARATTDAGYPSTLAIDTK
jgi:mercuric ion binding protein